jgi:hypothetical protein
MRRNLAITVGAFFFTVSCVLVAVLVDAIRYARDGYEDEFGFHFGTIRTSNSIEPL